VSRAALGERAFPCSCRELGDVASSLSRGWLDRDPDPRRRQLARRDKGHYPANAGKVSQVVLRWRI